MSWHSRDITQHHPRQYLEQEIQGRQEQLQLPRKQLVGKKAQEQLQREHKNRQQRQHPQRRQTSGINPVRCNLCRKPLSATVFVLSCNCLFCEECTFSHFEKNQNCPGCNRTMGEKDFRELMILKQPTPDKVKESVYKRIFVKSSPDAKTLNSYDIWNRIQGQHAMNREGTKFVLRQFLKENAMQTKRFSGIQHALRATKEDNDNLKREINKHKETVEGYQQELLVASQKIEEKDRQLAQFRKMFDSRTSSSSHTSTGSQSGHRGGAAAAAAISAATLGGGPQSSIGSGRGAPTRARRVSDFPLHSQDYRQQQQQQQHGHQEISPQIPTVYTLQDSTNTYEQQLGGTTLYATQPPPQPYNSAMSRSPSRQHHNNIRHGNSQHIHSAVQNPYRKPTQALMVTQTQTQRSNPSRHFFHSGGGSVASFRSTGSGSKIRNITATTGYSFSGSSSNSNGGRAEQEQQREHHHNSHERWKNKHALSPSHAYGAASNSNSNINPYNNTTKNRPRGPSSQGYRRCAVPVLAEKNRNKRPTTWVPY